MNVSLHLIYESEIGRPLTAAKVHDKNLIRQAARTAIKDAFERAKMVADQDTFLGDVQREEAERLQRVLQIMVPELNVTNLGGQGLQ
jgi:hypothetical protein